MGTKVVPILCSYQGSSQVARWLRRHLAALEFKVVSLLGEDFCDNLARSGQQQIVNVEYQ